MLAQVLGRLVLFGGLILPLAVGCVGSARYNAGAGEPADPWSGFWTILLAILVLIVGFLVGATATRNGGIRISTHRHHHRRTQAGWNRIARDIQAGTKQGLADWRGAGHGEDGDWDDLNRSVEERILEEMRKHRD